MADKGKVTNSRKKVICDFCGDDFEQRYLKTHTDSMHTGRKPTIRPDANQPRIQFAKPRAKRPSESEENPAERVKVARTEEPVEHDVESDELVSNTVQTEMVADPVTNEDIMKTIKLSTEMLLESMKEMKNEKSEKEKESADNEDFGHLLREARNFADITNSFSEITYREAEQVLTCDLCFDRKIDCAEDGKHCTKPHSGLFKVENIEEPVTETLKREVTTEAFRNLKKSVKRHIESQTHKQKILELKQTTNTKGQEQKSEKEAGMRCARLCQELYKKGRPFTDYPEMVALMVKNDVFMGDTNHSKEFPAKFILSVSTVVRKTNS